MANYWNKNSGDVLLTLEEQVTIAPFLLPLSEPNATVKIIPYIWQPENIYIKPFIVDDFHCEKNIQGKTIELLFKVL